MPTRHFQRSAACASDAVELDHINHQHLRIFELIKEFNSAVRDGVDQDHLILILDEVIECTQVHFLAEEAMIKATAPSAHRLQRSEHRLIMDELASFRRAVLDGRASTQAQRLHAMDSLLVHHIKDEPAGYAVRADRHAIHAAVG